MEEANKDDLIIMLKNMLINRNRFIEFMGLEDEFNAFMVAKRMENGTTGE